MYICITSGHSGTGSNGNQGVLHNSWVLMDLCRFEKKHCFKNGNR